MAQISVQRVGESVLLGIPLHVEVDEVGSACVMGEILLAREHAIMLASALFHAANGHTPSGIDDALERILE